MSAPDDGDADWLLKLQMLLLRHPEFGAAADLASMTRPEAWGLYCLIRRLTET